MNDIKENILSCIFLNNDQYPSLGGGENNSNENKNEVKSILFSNSNNNNKSIPISNENNKSIHFNNNKNINNENIMNENINILNNSNKSINFNNNKNINNENIMNENINILNNSNKSINFNNNKTIKSINSENENDNSISFPNNNLEGNNITKFFSGDNDIIIEEEVAIKLEDIIYKNDLVYLKELENQLLSEFPVTKQNEKFIQNLVENNAKKIIEIKNIGVRANEMFKKGIEYKLINELINENFISHNIIPIVLDKHKIYVKLEEEQNENIEASFSETFENKNGIIEINQKTQFTELNKLSHLFALNKMPLKEYLNEVNNITKPYDCKENRFGYSLNLKSNTNLLRFYDHDTEYWDTHYDSPEYNSVKDVFDDLGKIIGTEQYALINGTNINLVGLMKKEDKYLKKEFKPLRTITKISNSNNNNILLEINNHGLKEEDYNIIYINETNSFPKINNLYRKSVKIIDKNNIELNINEKLLINGNYGILHTLSKLDFDLYEIKKEKDSIQINKNNENSNKPNKIYLFDKILVNKNDFDTILKKIMPSLNELINNNLKLLKKAYTFEDVNNILKKNYININSLHIEQIIIIKEIFKNNLNKFLSQNKIYSYPLNFNKLNNKLVNDENYFLSNSNITNIELIKYYTEYIHLNKPEDNFILRLRWLLSQKDNGEYFMLKFSSITKNYNKTYLKNKIDYLNDLLKDIEKNFNKEKGTKIYSNTKNKLYNYQAKEILNEKDAKDLISETLLFYKNNLYKNKNGKLEIIDNIDNNSLLLVEDTIYKWEKNKWEKTTILPKYNNIKYLCELNNNDIENLKLDSLDCIYRKDLGCKSKLYVRLEETSNQLKENLSDFKKLLEHNYNKIINNKINYLQEKYYNGRILEPILLKKNNFIFEPVLEPILDSLSVLTNIIKKISNYNTQLNYIYMLIEKDGLLIGKDIYSKKYNRKMNICGHYYFFKKINYAEDPNNKILFSDLLFSIYGDDGEAEKNYITCKHCGEILMNNDYDDTEGFSDSGMIKKSRELWTVDEVDKIYDKEKDLLNYIKSTNIEDKAFKEILIKHGISIDDIEDAINISIFIVKNLFMKAGVILPNTELISIIIDSMQKIKRIIPYRIFRVKEIKKYQDKGFSQEYIDSIESKDIIKNDYLKNKQIKKNCIITARFLISIQITVPTLVRSSKDTICPFFSFDGEEGLSYMSCILEEMQMISYTDKLKLKELLKLYLTDEYNEFIKLASIQKLFKMKKEYNSELLKKKKNSKFLVKELNQRKNLIIEVENENKEKIDFGVAIKTSKNSKDLYKVKTKLIYTLKYLTYKIENIVEKVIDNSAITDQYVGLVEVSCCLENAESYLDYYYYIESKTNIKKYIEESNNLYDNIFYFIDSGSIHKFLLFNPKRFDGIYNKIITDDLHSSESVIKAVFEYFVDKGPYAGTKREYIGDVNNPIDFKSGLSKKEILSKNYTEKEYLILLNEIEKHNIKYFKPFHSFLFDKEQINNMKKNSEENLDKEINKLVNNISTILNKDKKFNENYKRLFRNFGVFNIDKDLENMTMKEKIKYRENVNITKMDYTKKFYISKLKKYLSIIKNFNSDKDIIVNFEPDKEKKLELQKFIFEENKRLEPFLNENIRKYFIELKTTFSNEEINSINGISDIYNSTYENIKKYSDFNFNDAANVLLYILVNDLNKFIYTKKNDLEKNKYICRFILILMEDLENEDELFNNCDTIFITNNEIHERIEYLSKNFTKKKEEGISLLQSLLKQTKSIDYLAEKLEEEEIQNEYDNDYKEKIEFIMEKGKKDLFNKYGYEPTEEQLENYKNSYLSDMQEAEDVSYFDDGFSGKEILDAGGDYGGFTEHDFETGDGFDYSDEMEYN